MYEFSSIECSFECTALECVTTSHRPFGLDIPTCANAGVNWARSDGETYSGWPHKWRPINWFSKNRIVWWARETLKGLVSRRRYWTEMIQASSKTMFSAKTLNNFNTLLIYRLDWGRPSSMNNTRERMWDSTGSRCASARRTQAQLKGLRFSSQGLWQLCVVNSKACRAEQLVVK